MANDRLPMFESVSPGATASQLVQSECDFIFFEDMNDTKEQEELAGDHKGLMTVDRLQMLCDVAATAAANAIPTNQRFLGSC